MASVVVTASDITMEEERDGLIALVAKGFVSDHTTLAIRAERRENRCMID